MRHTLPPLSLIAALTVGGCATLGAHRDLDALPTSDVHATRVGGAAPQLPQAVRDRHAGELLRGTYRVCLDVPSGRVLHLRPVRSLSGPGDTADADRAVMAALRSGRWLVQVGPEGAPRTLCFLEGVEFPIAGKSRLVSAPAADGVRRRRLGGALPHLPAAVALAHRGETLRGAYRICVDGRSGLISHVAPLQGIAGADEAVAGALLTWSWVFAVPRAVSGSLCFREQLRFTVPRGPLAEEGAVATTADPRIDVELRDGAPLRRSFVFRKRRLAGQRPALPDPFRVRHAGLAVTGIYRLCADGGGAVTSVAPVVGLPGADGAVVGALRTWRYDPAWPRAVLRICFLEQLRFTVERPRPEEDRAVGLAQLAARRAIGPTPFVR